MSSISQEQTRINKKESKGRRTNRVLAYGATLIALAGVGGIMKVHEADKDARAAAEFNVLNQEHNVVTFGAGMTPYIVASEAVSHGYLDMQTNEARGFITDQLQQQMRDKGLLKPEEEIDLGAIAPGTQLEVPGTWEGIGKPEEKPSVEIGTAITAESDGKGNVITKETNQSGHTTTTVEPQG